MDFDKIGGIIVLLVLILSVGLTGYSSIATLSDDSNDSVHNITLTQAQLNQSSANGSSNISTVNVNINQKSGGVDLKFADSDNIYNIASDDSNNTTNVEYNVNENGELDVNITSDDAGNEIILSNKYTYNINGQLVTGGLNCEATPNSKINSLIFNTTTGGVNLELNGGTLNNANINIVAGGLNIKGTPNGVSNINSNVTVGGVSLDLNQSGYKINSHTEVGGSQIQDVSGSPDCQYTSTQYDTTNNKVNINSYVRVGGFYDG